MQPMPNDVISPAQLSLIDGAGGLCSVVPAASDRQASVDQLVLDHLPSADLLVLVDWRLSAGVDSHIGQADVRLLQLLCRP